MSKVQFFFDDYEHDQEGFILCEKDEWESFQQKVRELPTKELFCEIDDITGGNWNSADEYLDSFVDVKDITDEEYEVLKRTCGTHYGTVLIPNTIEFDY